MNPPETRLSGSLLQLKHAKADPWSMVQEAPNCPLQKPCSLLWRACCVSLQLQPWREEAPQPPTQATMSADTLQVLASAGQGKTTRGLLRVIILALIAAAAIASRLFSVIRTCPVSPLPPLVVMASWSSGCHIGHARASRNPPIIQRVGLWSSWHANQVLSSLCRIREYYP